MQPTVQEKWQALITTLVVMLIIFNFYLLFFGRWPFSAFSTWQNTYLGGEYVAFTIVALLFVLAVELVPFFVIKWMVGNQKT
ncbi:TPA: hypothetical protein HA278_01175 [Candidatus Woesearchaeota archaeon]|nr:hypothetical protein [Candidatus Woesearchaeota archaeon]|tara:strand:+ start:44 stop:289 length:246 start_codon:yes stop_codon:yes gene_type:complete